jgi:hypothetical protein
MEILRKGRENRKANELGFPESWLPSSHLLGYMEATESLKYPFLPTTDTSPSRAVLEDFKLSPSDGCLAEDQERPSGRWMTAP